MSHVPKLEVDGGNWIIFQIRLTHAFSNHRVLGHLTGTDVRPSSDQQSSSSSVANPSPNPQPPAPVGVTTRSRPAPTATTSTPELITPSPASITDDTPSPQAELWDLKENKARDLLYRVLPDTIVMELIHYDTTAEAWDHLVQKYDGAMMAHRVELEEELQSFRMDPKGNVREHVAALRMKREQLSRAGAVISEPLWVTTVMKSLVGTVWWPWARNLTSAAKLNGYANVDSEVFLNALISEYDSVQWMKRLKKPKPTNDTALTATDSGASSTSSGRRGRRGKGKGNGGEAGAAASESPAADSDVVCHNCGGRGHKSPTCPSPKYPKGQPGTSGGKGSGSGSKPSNSKFLSKKPASANAAAEEPESFDSQWSAVAFESVSPMDPFIHSDELMEPADAPPVPDVALSAISDGAWRYLFDSGATSHMCPDRNLFFTFRDTIPHSIQGASNTFQSTGVGEIIIEIPTETGKSQLRLKNVLYAPQMNMTLISIGRIVDAGMLVTFTPEGTCRITDASGNCRGIIPKKGGLYFITGRTSDAALTANSETVSLFELHRRLGHVAQSTVKSMYSKGLLPGYTLDPGSKIEFCRICTDSKITIAPIPTKRSTPEATAFGDVIHTDVWGPAQVQTYDGKSYYVSFTDEATRDTFIYLLRVKSDVFSTYKKFCAYLLTNHNVHVKVLQSDRGGEYLSAN